MFKSVDFLKGADYVSVFLLVNFQVLFFHAIVHVHRLYKEIG